VPVLHLIIAAIYGIFMDFKGNLSIFRAAVFLFLNQFKKLAARLL